jgi:hypothetical protein
MGIVAVLEFDYADVLSFGLTDQQGQRLVDGAYTFELRLVRAEPKVSTGARANHTAADLEASTQEASALKEAPVDFSTSGRFQIVNGLLVPPASPQMRALERTAHATTKVFDWTGDYSISGKLLVGFDGIPIEDIHIQCDDNDGSCPAGIVFQNANLGATVTAEQWAIQVDRTRMGFRNGATLDGTIVFTMEKGAPANSLYIADNGYIGNRTANPTKFLHIYSPTDSINSDVFFDTDTQDWGLHQWSNAFGFKNYTLGGTAPFYVEDLAPQSSLVVEDSGSVGMGTGAPDASLEVTRSNGTAKILVDENSAVVNKRFLLQLENNGAPQFRFDDTSTGTAWQFSMLTNGNFAIDRLGDTGAEMLIRTDGSVKMGPGGTQKFAMDASGNVTIQGTLTELSDVNAKKGFQAVTSSDVLAAVADLPVSTWVRKQDPTGSRHMGPTAQDFHAAFGLGEDNRHISPYDVASVALVAAQALQAENAELKARIDKLEALIADLVE